jgi:hypothetical protein
LKIGGYTGSGDDDDDDDDDDDGDDGDAVMVVMMVVMVVTRATRHLQAQRNGDRTEVIRKASKESCIYITASAH